MENTTTEGTFDALRLGEILTDGGTDRLRNVIDAAEGYAAYLRREGFTAEKGRRTAAAEELYREAATISTDCATLRARLRGATGE
jgi:hypothetical protein